MNALPFLLALLLPLGRALPAQDDADADGNKLVKVALKSDRSVLQAGHAFTLAVHCRIEPRWHVYWGENPGDSGLPFKAEVTGPTGYEIGKLRFPWPKREESEGDIVTFVQAGEMTILVDVKVPATAKAGDEAKFDVACRWLVCTDVCVAGSGSVSLSLTVGDQEKPADEALFSAWRAKMPRPWSEMPRAMATWSGEEKAPKLTLVIPGIKAAEFFPYTSPTTQMTGRKLEIGKQGGTLAVDFEFKKKNDGDVPLALGVLWVKTDQGETSYLLEKPFQK